MNLNILSALFAFRVVALNSLDFRSCGGGLRTASLLGEGTPRPAAACSQAGQVAFSNS